MLRVNVRDDTTYPLNYETAASKNIW
ncbi:hypothetical protein CEXT_629701, partial [Caerostris extrusa]